MTEKLEMQKQQIEAKNQRDLEQFKKKLNDELEAAKSQARSSTMSDIESIKLTVECRSAYNFSIVLGKEARRSSERARPDR